VCAFQQSNNRESLSFVLFAHFLSENLTIFCVLLECWNDWFMEPWKESPWVKRLVTGQVKRLVLSVCHSNNPTTERAFLCPFHTLSKNVTSYNVDTGSGHIPRISQTKSITKICTQARFARPPEGPHWGRVWMPQKRTVPTRPLSSHSFPALGEHTAAESSLPKHHTFLQERGWVGVPTFQQRTS